MTTDILWFSELGLKDLDRVGGKNAGRPALSAFL